MGDRIRVSKLRDRARKLEADADALEERIDKAQKEAEAKARSAVDEHLRRQAIRLRLLVHQEAYGDKDTVPWSELAPIVAERAMDRMEELG